MSASYCADPVSVSPAASFLSMFSSPKPVEPVADAEGHVVSGFVLGPIVGHGAFSIIRTAFPASGGVVAVKIVKRADHFKQGNAALAKKQIKHEAEIWSSLSHEHILPLFSSFHNTYGDYFFTLYCPAGSLFDILKRDGCPALPQDDAGMMFRQVVRGLRYLHEVALLVHRDIKLENVLVDESGVCRIGDFGMTAKIGEVDEVEDEQQNPNGFPVGHATVQRAVSLVVPGSKKTPRTSLHVQLARHRNSTSTINPPPGPVQFQPGSLPYAAPELLLPHAGPLLPHPAQDIWALGVLLYGLLTGRLPFSDSFEPRLQMKILNGAYDVPPDIGRGAERVLQGCLDRSDSTRWTIAMVDEVAWGIGWGAEGDDVTPADSDEEFQSQRMPSASRSHSRCPPEVTISGDPEWQREEPRSRPSLEAASRRSSSRIQRSLSRAPVIVPSRSSSTRPILTRSVSQQSQAQSPSVCALNVSATSARSPSGIRSPSSARSPSSSRSSRFYDAHFALSPPLSVERGRRRQTAPGLSSSRSPSPSIAPTTPTDNHTPFSTSRDVLEVRPDDIERSSSRGRPRFSRGIRPDHDIYPADADTRTELDVLDETADWAAPGTSGSKPAPFISEHTHAPPLSAISDSYAPHTANPYDRRRGPRSQSKPSYNPSHASESRRPGSSPPTQAPRWPAAAGTGSGLRRFAMPERLRAFPNSILTPVQPTTSVDRLTRSRSQ
ncbi:kinase-like domain-containing protein [Lyophyllum atratum]|nr:kinase-like domain-containing protein [Lyophyllum atratum]